MKNLMNRIREKDAGTGRKLLSGLIIVFLSVTLTLGQNKNNTNQNQVKMEKATFGAGCFWCVEAVFQELKGVKTVYSGYSGGKIDNPTYKEVCSGRTGHAEVIQITYDPSQITFAELLEVFWKTHDPTTLNRQGADEGTQYRSVIFYHTPEQKALAEKYKKELNESKAFENPVVTEISPFSKFFEAEDYHQNYFAQNGGQPYCQIVIKPKLDKFRKVFKDKLSSSTVK
jgi:peptide-methionine (S)-S-oxide reductase